jgi:ribose transport system substrate-binding protein
MTFQEEKMKKISVVLLGLLVMLIPVQLFAGGRQDAASGNSKEITVICMALDSDWWHMVEAGALLAGVENPDYTIRVIGPNSESNSQQQLNMVEDAVAKHVAAIVLAPNQPTVLVEGAQKAKAASVPLIVVDARLDTTDNSLFTGFIGTNNVEAGKRGGEYLAERLSRGDQVGIIRGQLSQPTHDQRAQGAKEAFEAAGLQVVSIQPADSSRGLAVNVAENMLQANPNIKAFFCTNDEMAMGTYEAVKGLGKEGIMIMGFDGSFGALDSIKNGQMTASVAQGAIAEGYLGVKAAIEVIEGRRIEKFVDNPITIVDIKNVTEFRKNIEDRLAQIN